jgi:hypothetical protein
MAALVVSIWPSYRTSLAVIDLPPAIEAFLGTDLWIGTAPGFISAEYFSWIPILLIVFVIARSPVKRAAAPSISCWRSRCRGHRWSS